MVTRTTSILLQHSSQTDLSFSVALRYPKRSRREKNAYINFTFLSPFPPSSFFNLVNPTEKGIIVIII